MSLLIEKGIFPFLSCRLSQRLSASEKYFPQTDYMVYPKSTVKEESPAMPVSTVTEAIEFFNVLHEHDVVTYLVSETEIHDF